MLIYEKVKNKTFSKTKKSYGHLLLMIFRCSLDSAEVRRRYQEGNQAEAEETTNIMLVPMVDVLELQEKEVWPNMAPSAKGCVTLYQIAMANRKKES